MRKTNRQPDEVACINVYGTLPHLLGAGLLHELSNTPEDLLRPRCVSQLRNTIRQHDVPKYERDWASFAYLYFGANFIKSYLAVQQICWPDNQSPVRLLDLGCGGGASTAGALLALSQHADVSEIIAVDCCKQQVELARKVVSPWITAEFSGKNFEVVHEDLFALLRSRDWDNTLAIASYVTPELSSAEFKSLRPLMRQQLKDSSEALIVESHPAQHGLLLELLNGKRSIVSYDRIEMDLSFLNALNLTEKPKFAARTDVTTILESYFRAWEAYDIEEISRIFRPDAVYEIIGSKTLNGIAEIVEYWRQNATRQRGVECKLLRLKACGDLAVAAWRADFERVDLSQRRTLHGLLEIQLIEGRIAFLREAFSQDIESLTS